MSIHTGKIMPNFAPGETCPLLCQIVEILVGPLVERRTKGLGLAGKHSGRKARKDCGEWHTNTLKHNPTTLVFDVCY
jgi:hypothetical protein